ncbi:MAG: sigma-70 family RNA polymerase sigma factor [Defluviitaleaceae bacterium]|nr:sigma-70 family RNA polymerase sigma factor [Defluviitaleaceae bacterium]
MSVREEVVPYKKQIQYEMDTVFLESIYTRYYDNVYNYICFRINNHFDSEELTSDVFVSAISRFHTYKPEIAPIEAWLIGIAKNVITDYLRKKKRKIFIPLDDIVELISPERRPEEIIVFSENNKALITAMAKLKDLERQILSMKFATDLKNPEIAQIMNLSETNVGTICYRAVKKLKKIMDKEGL